MQEAFDTVLTVLSTLGAVWLGHFLTASHSGKSKLLDLRREAYGRVLAHLKRAEVQCSVIDDHIEHVGAIEYFHGPASNKHASVVGQHLAEARAVVNESFLVASQEFLTVFQKFDVSIDEMDGYASPEEEHAVFAHKLREAMTELLMIARRELGLTIRAT